MSCGFGVLAVSYNDVRGNEIFASDFLRQILAWALGQDVDHQHATLVTDRAFHNEEPVSSS
jgi:hypothetical protein